MMKTCRKCKKEKEKTFFHKNCDSADGLQYYCKACHYEHCKDWEKKNPEAVKTKTQKYRLAHPDRVRAWEQRYRIANASKLKEKNRRQRFLKYGLTEEKFKEILLAQDNRCAICERELRAPKIDHCHATGVLRGILCNSCNTALGKFQDSEAILNRAIKYLKAAADT